MDDRDFAQKHSLGGEGAWNPQLLEAASWRLASELCRRFPAQFHLAESHPGGGMYDCLSAVSPRVSIDLNRAGSLHVWLPGGGGPQASVPIWPAMMKTEDYHRLLDDVCVLAQLVKPESMPSTTPMTLAYRLIAAFLSHAVFGVHHWECRQGYRDTSGYGGGTMHQYFKPFPWARTRLQPVRGQAAVDNSDEFWFLLCDGKPRLVLHTSGWAARPRAKKGVELMPLYARHGRRVWPVVMEVAGDLLP